MWPRLTGASHCPEQMHGGLLLGTGKGRGGSGVPDPPPCFLFCPSSSSPPPHLPSWAWASSPAGALGQLDSRCPASGPKRPVRQVHEGGGQPLGSTASSGPGRLSGPWWPLAPGPEAVCHYLVSRKAVFWLLLWGVGVGRGICLVSSLWIMILGSSASGVSSQVQPSAPETQPSS